MSASLPEPAAPEPLDPVGGPAASVLRQVADRTGLALEVVQAHGHPHATAAALVDVGPGGATWRVLDGGTERELLLAWRTQPTPGGDGTDDGETRWLAGVEELHAVATASLRWSRAMGEHGMLRYSGPVDGA